MFGDQKDGNLIRKHKIIEETVRKEKECQKIYTNYTVNPYKLGDIMASKFYSKYESVPVPEDPVSLEVIKRSKAIPANRFPYPLTESQHMTWITDEMIPVPIDRNDTRLYHPKKRSSITKFMDQYFACNKNKNN
ncbi:cilia- and flagella-associated protein 144-like [Centruroides vittatus]|uniref:cilia- and flagella-associated protein 144-like n=1 Tax=Centruroides vittatus TaxID=120091 RepID=UPI00350FA229